MPLFALSTVKKFTAGMKQLCLSFEIGGYIGRESRRLYILEQTQAS